MKRYLTPLRSNPALYRHIRLIHAASSALRHSDHAGVCFQTLAQVSPPLSPEFVYEAYCRFRHRLRRYIHLEAALVAFVGFYPCLPISLLFANRNPQENVRHFPRPSRRPRWHDRVMLTDVGVLHANAALAVRCPECCTLLDKFAVCQIPHA